ncbi:MULTISPECIES: hypothetical protein [unclassified Bacillus (in: firmicutes)]|uniref:hypothetical protein n=1 Tax=unclassified Bacillus (in: firmicutes) TaxID=185979 RepID=UPI0033657D22
MEFFSALHLTLLFLPPYSPNLNAVEHILGWLDYKSVSCYTQRHSKINRVLYGASRCIFWEGTPAYRIASHVEKLIGIYIVKITNKINYKEMLKFQSFLLLYNLIREGLFKSITYIL